MSKARELIASLASEGELESEGQFTLDREKAREKLQRFQLAEPERYVVLLAEAALMGGATELHIRVDADDVRMEFDGALITREDLEGLWDSILGDSGARPGLRQLALALNAAMGLRPKFLRVESGPSEDRYRLALAPDHSTVVESRPPGGDKNFVHIRERLHFGSFADAIDARQGDRREQVLLREHCRYVDVVVQLDGREIATGFPNKIGGSTLHFEGEGFRGCVGLGPQGSFASEFTFCSHGLKIVSHRFEDLPSGLVGVVNSTRLQRDVSQADVRRDEHFEELLATARQSAWQCIARAAPIILDPRADASGTLDWKAPERHGLIYGALQKAGAAALQGDHPLDPLLDHPLWRTVSHRVRTTRELIDGLEDESQVPYVSSSFEDFVPEGEEEVLLVLNELHRMTLQALFANRLENRQGRFAKALKAHRNELRWRASRLEPVLPSGAWMRRLSFEQGKVRGEVGLRHEPGRIDVLVEGGHLCSFEHDLPLEGLHVVVEGPFTPRKNFDGVHKDERLAKALLVVAEAIADLFGELEGPYGEHSSLRAHWIDAMLEFFLNEHYGIELFEAAGFKRAKAKRHLRQLKSGKIRPRLDPREREAHPLARIPIFGAMHTPELLSLRRVMDSVVHDGHILYFDALSHMSGGERDGPPALLLNEAQVELIEYIWGGEILRDAVPVYERWRARRAHMNQSPSPSGAETIARLPHLWSAGSVEEGAIRLDFGLNREQLDGWRPGDSTDAYLEVRFEARPLLQIHITSVIPGLHVIAAIPEEACEPNFADMNQEAFLVVRQALDDFVDELDFEAAVSWHLDRGALTTLGAALLWHYRSHDDYLELVETRLRPFADRIEFETLQGANINLTELMARSAEASALEYCDRIELIDLADRPLIGLDASQLDFASQLIPFPTRDVSEELLSRKRAKQLEARPKVEALNFSREMLVDGSVNESTPRGRIQGQIGFPRVDPFNNEGRLACHVDMRLVETCANPLDLPVDLVVDAPFSLRRVDEVGRDATFDDVRRLAQLAIPELLEQLLDDWTPKRGGVGSLRARWVVAAAGSVGEARLSDELRQKVLEHPFLGRYEKGPTNIAALRKANEQGKRTSWIDEGRAPLLRPPVGTLLLDVTIANALYRAFGLELRDKTEALYRRRLAQEQRPPIETLIPRPHPPSSAFASGEVGRRKGGWSAKLWIDAFEGRLEVACEGRHVTTLDLWKGLTISGVVEVEGDKVSDDWQSTILDDELPLIRKRGYELIRELADLVDRNELDSPIARHRLASFHAHLANADRALGGAEVKVKARLYRCGIIADPWGKGWTSPQEIERRRKEKETEASAKRVAREAARRANWEAQRQLFAGAAKRVTEAFEGIEEAVESFAKPVSDPTVELVTDLRRRLRSATRAAAWPKAEHLIDQIECTSGPKKFAYRYKSGPQLHRDHPLVQHCLDKPEDEAARLLLSSVAATAINLWVEDIYDRHELTLLLKLMRELNPKQAPKS